MLDLWFGVRCALMFAALVLAGCASTPTADNAGDPHEALNRKFYAFNDTLDKADS
jgi:ABC-type transporter lipoprotein component MlaA